jgi:hypothetical protein
MRLPSCARSASAENTRSACIRRALGQRRVVGVSAGIGVLGEQVTAWRRAGTARVVSAPGFVILAGTLRRNWLSNHGGRSADAVP